MKCRLTGEETNHAFCLFENCSDGSSKTPVHMHANEDETVHVIDGEMQAVIAGMTHTARAGDAIFLPRGVPHHLVNASGHPSRYSILCTPSGFEEFVAECGRVAVAGELASPPSPEEVVLVKDAALRLGISLLPGF